MELKILLQEINSLRDDIDQLRPLNAETESRIMQKFRLDWNYHSNSIEGNKLTYGETKTFLLHGITANGKPLKDHLDIKGHNEAILLLEDIIKESRGITENFIRELHIIILKEGYSNKSITTSGQYVERKIDVGKYKAHPNHVRTRTGEMHYFASPEETPAKMHDLIEWYRKNNDSAHPLLTAALFHYKFIAIHPFDDGNGRLARILMNLILMQNGYPPAIIKTEKKEEYYRALQAADGGNETAFVEYIGEQLLHSLDLYLKGAKGENIDEITDVDKQIDLLKATLNGENEKMVLDKVHFDRLYEEIVRPLFQKTLNKLEKFDELFFEKEVTVLFFGEENTVKDNAIDLLDAFKQKYSGDVGDIGFKYRLHEFKKSSDINIDILIILMVRFNRYDYLSIYSFPHEFSKVNIPFKNPKLNYDDEILIVNSTAKYVLDQINLKLKP